MVGNPMRGDHVGDRPGTTIRTVALNLGVFFRRASSMIAPPHPNTLTGRSNSATARVLSAVDNLLAHETVLPNAPHRVPDSRSSRPWGCRCAFEGPCFGPYQTRHSKRHLYCPFVCKGWPNVLQIQQVVATTAKSCVGSVASDTLRQGRRQDGRSTPSLPSPACGGG
jgi:hypothetical protein